MKNNNKIDNYEINLKPKISQINDLENNEVIHIPENCLGKTTIEYLMNKDDENADKEISQTFDLDDRYILSIN